MKAWHILNSGSKTNFNKCHVDIHTTKHLMVHGQAMLILPDNLKGIVAPYQIHHPGRSTF